MNIARTTLRSAVLIALTLQVAAADRVDLPPAPGTPAPPVAPAAPVEPVDPFDAAPEPPEPPGFPRGGRGGVSADGGVRVQAEVERARRDAERHLRDLNSGLAQIQRSFGGASIRVGGPNSFRALVLPAGDGEADTGAIREELSIMSRVLAKSLDSETERRTSPFRFEFGDVHLGARTDLDAMYLEGYGAVFFLEVEYPLAASPSNPEKQAEKRSEEDEAWEQARREVRGELDPDSPDGHGPELMTLRERKRPAFDAEQVESLRVRLVEALRHARNLKSLRDGETVTVVVSGPGAREAGVSRRTRVRAGGAAGWEMYVVSGGGGSGPGTGTVMTLRVRKSDLVDLGPGKEGGEELAKRVKVSTRHEGPAPRPPGK